MAENPAVRLTVTDSVATLTLTQADRGNPLDFTFAAGLHDAMETIVRDDTIRALLITAEGKNFSFGGDVKAFAAHSEDVSQVTLPLLRDLRPGLVGLAELGKPVVAAVQGWCVGGALGLISYADVVVADAKARFKAAFPAIGLSNDCGSTWGTAHRMGLAAAQRFMMSNKVLDATAAREAGLVDEISSHDSYLEKATQIAHYYAAGPTRAYAGIKRNFRTIEGISFAAMYEAEMASMAKAAASHDATEGVLALAEKREPTFTGR